MNKELWSMINELDAEGLSIRAIASRAGVHRHTVRKALKMKHPPARSGGMRRAGVIDPYRGWLMAREVCLHNMPVLFTSAVHIINDLAAAQRQGMLKRAMKKYVKPAMLVIDELGYLPVDRVGAELIFQVLSERYEKASTVITTNRVYKHWAKTFDNDATLASAVLDRVMHHSETVVIKGESYRQKNIIDR